MLSVNLVIEGEWLTIESEIPVVVRISSEFGSVYKQSSKYNSILHPLLPDIVYRVEIYTRGRVLVTTKNEWVHLKHYKRGGVFYCEFKL